jgi:hypothetical protein
VEQKIEDERTHFEEARKELLQQIEQEVEKRKKVQQTQAALELEVQKEIEKVNIL